MLTPKELKQRREQDAIAMKAYKGKVNAFRRKVRSNISQQGFNSVRYQLEYLQGNHNAKPDNGLSLEDTIAVIKDILDEHLNKQRDENN